LTPLQEKSLVYTEKVSTECEQREESSIIFNVSHVAACTH